MTANAPKPNTVPIKKFVAPAPANQKTTEKPKYDSEVKTIVEAPSKPPIVKKPFVRKPHLTDRPFKDNAGLQALREKMQKDQQRRNQRSRVNIKSK
jgi:hypothetical protein